MKDFATLEDLQSLNILPFDTDIVDENFIGELARRSLNKNNEMCESAG